MELKLICRGADGSDLPDSDRHAEHKATKAKNNFGGYVSR